MTAQMSCCDIPEKPFASENQYISTSLKVVAPKDKLQVKGRQQKTEAINFFFQICIQQLRNLLI